VNLWGESKTPYFLLDSLYIKIYHDQTMKGYGAICKEVSRWYKVTPKSLTHNVKVCRKELYEWSTSKLFSHGDFKEWNKDAVEGRFKKEFKNANLWMDSTDLPKEGIKKFSRKSREWSYKLNRETLYCHNICKKEN
jgi:hypothetical protein